MDYRLAIAQRYLSGRRSMPLISRITAISAIGVALGVAALIVVLSVLNGFFDFVRDMLVSHDPHVRIVQVDMEAGMGENTLMALALEHPSVESVVPYIEGKALIMHDAAADVNKIVHVRGVDPAHVPTSTGVASAISFGNYDLGRQNRRPGIVIGKRLGERLLLTPGSPGQPASRIALVSAPAIERMFTRVLSGSPLRQFEVRGLFELQSMFDESYVEIHIDEARRLFDQPTGLTGLDLRLSSLDEAARVKGFLLSRLDPKKFTVETWYDLQRPLYDVMQLEKYGALLVLMLIVLVAAFNIVGSLTMIVIEKRRDVGALRAMGVARRDIRRIFLLEGLLIGAAGSGAGVILGVLVSLAQKQYGFVKLADAGSFLIDAYPVAIRTADVSLIGILALGLCVLAAWYPAVRAAAINPAEAVAMSG
ncbi:MAG: permease [Bacteroidetes bacterium CG12_big_fil_rev_8_21_14_0_65_60_17]|nr:MAG: permease [Bacteroidetes bacterium CG12_big_fil_rev_8_21_14_0_65_60_17]